MLQTLPAELILSIASHATPETKRTIAQTCHTCYSVIMPLIWRCLPVKAIENIDGLVNVLIRNNWLALAKQFVHAIALTNDSVRRHTTEEVHNLIGATESGYPYLLENNNNRPTPRLLHSKSKSLAKKSFGDVVLELIQHFPQTSHLSIDYYLALPYLLVGRFASIDGPTNFTEFNGSVEISHYLSGQVEALSPLLAPFPRLTELSIQAQSALSYSDDSDSWLIGDADLIQLASLPLDHLLHLTIKDTNDRVNVDTYRTLLGSKPNLQSLTLQWRYRPTKTHIQALEELLDTIPWWYVNRMESDGIYSVYLTR